MITAKTHRSAGFAKRLASQASALGIAHGEATLRRHRSDGSHWRKPGLLWPLSSTEN